LHNKFIFQGLFFVPLIEYGKIQILQNLTSSNVAGKKPIKVQRHWSKKEVFNIVVGSIQMHKTMENLVHESCNEKKERKGTQV
jgi:hypothetical protein